MRRIFLAILILFVSNLTFGQDDYSTHSIDYYLNKNEKQINVSEIWIIVDGTKIFGEKKDDSYTFPIINPNTTFEFGITTNKMEFQSGPYKAWLLNNGSRITLGKLNRIDKLLSVAEYNEMDKSDNDYYTFAKRFL